MRVRGRLAALSNVRLPIFTAYWFGLNFLWGAVTTIVLPALVENVTPEAIQTTALALVAGLQALVAIVVQPLSGAISDELHSPWGRRRPLMVAGVALQLLSLGLLALVGSSYVGIVVAMLLVELFSNTAQGPYQGLLPDVVPMGRRGAAAAALGVGQLAGQVVGVALAGLAVAVGDVQLAIALSAVAVGIGTAVTVAGVREPADSKPDGGQDAARAGLDVGRTGLGLFDASRWRIPFRSTVLRVWGRDVLEHRDYMWVLVSRLAILMATGTFQPFVYFFLKDSLGLAGDTAAAVVPLAALVVLVAVVAAVPGGRLTERWGRVRTVRAAAAIGTVGSLAFALAPSYESLFIMAIPFGAALGIFLAADWALMVDLVPQAESGRYLGLSNTVTAGAALLAVAIGGPIADLVNQWSFGAGYRAIFALAGVEFLFGVVALLRVSEPHRESGASEVIAPGS
jgi:MFS family permease